MLAGERQGSSARLERNVDADMIEATENPGVVLHVEDDRLLAASLGALLKTKGYTTLTASDGVSALEWVTQRRARPELLIIDFNLPGEMDGTEVAEAVCRSLGHVLPTILLSGELPNAAMPWLPGAPIFPVWKPVDAEVLLKVVETFILLGRFLRARGRMFRP